MKPKRRIERWIGDGDGEFPSAGATRFPHRQGWCRRADRPPATSVGSADRVERSMTLARSSTYSPTKSCSRVVGARARPAPTPSVPRPRFPVEQQGVGAIFDPLRDVGVGGAPPLGGFVLDAAVLGRVCGDGVITIPSARPLDPTAVGDQDFALRGPAGVAVGVSPEVRRGVVHAIGRQHPRGAVRSAGQRGSAACVSAPRWRGPSIVVGPRRHSQIACTTREDVRFVERALRAAEPRWPRGCQRRPAEPDLEGSGSSSK